MSQRSVFAQVIKHIPRSRFESWVTKCNGNFKVRSFDCYSWFAVLLFGQLSGHDSIRAIEKICERYPKVFFKHHIKIPKRSTLSDANSLRPVSILQDCCQYMIERCQDHLGFKNTHVDHKNIFRAMDSSIISLCLQLSPWAEAWQHQINKRFKAKLAGVKIHTAIDLAYQIPQFLVITPIQGSDYTIARTEVSYPKGSTTVFDKAYMGYTLFNRINNSDAYFVTRSKTNCKFKVLKSQKTDRTRGYICDQIVKTNSKNRTPYQGKLRRIKYRDLETKKLFVFLTNRFDLSTETICELYKKRWQIEIFFKSIKQNLRLKKFLGNSANAVKAQIYVAIIAYLVLKMIRHSYKVTWSMSDTMAVLAAMLLYNEPLSRLLSNTPRTARYPPDLQLKLRF